MSRPPVFALVDCNNFFVSCERVFRPDLWEKPVAVLSNNDGCIVARSNEVKALGVPMGVPLFKVRDIIKANNVTLFSGNFKLYGDFSQRVVSILRQESPRIEVYSVDESFLEISSLPIGDYTAWARTLRDKIFAWTGIPVSVGVAPSKTLAKAAADYAKKNLSCGAAFALVPDESLTPVAADQKRRELLRWLPVGDVWGVGRRLAPKLLARGVRTGYDLSLTSQSWAQTNMTIRGVKLLRELNGQSCFGVSSDDEPQKSIARTRSFPHAVRDYYELEAAVATFAAQAAAKLRANGEITGVVTTFLRTSHHAQVRGGAAKTVHLLPPAGDTGTIMAAALEGLKAIYDPELGYRKGGVILAELRPQTARQLSFASQPAAIDRQTTLMNTIDTMNAKLGQRTIRHASEHLNRSGWQSLRQKRSPQFTTSWAELPVVH